MFKYSNTSGIWQKSSRSLRGKVQKYSYTKDKNDIPYWLRNVWMAACNVSNLAR